MMNNIHSKFILTPLSEILKECINAVKGIGKGIENYPLCEYIMQTTFLKMTGESEQKLKCIVWEIATFDFEFRYEFLRKTQNYGEYSSLEQKKNVFKDLKKEIIKFSNQVVLQILFTDSVKNTIKGKIKDMTDLIGTSCIVKWQEREFLFFKKNFDSFFDINSFCKYDAKNQNLSFFDKTDEYEKIVFRHRNRCAHNLKSYQVNLPDFSSFVDKNYDYQNYFFRFAILILLDEIFMCMYQKYLELLNIC